VLTKPTDLTDAALEEALRSGWGFEAVSCEYLAVGAGGHHWLVIDASGARRFLAATDLPVFVRGQTDTVDALYVRLRAALRTALVLRERAGLEFVAAPLRRDDGEPIGRLSPRYSLTVYDFLDGAHAGEDGQYREAGVRRAVLDLLVQIHRVKTGEALADDFVLPHLHQLRLALDDSGRIWDGGRTANEPGNCS
jgi:spectinomycin phosphotransferase